MAKKVKRLLELSECCAALNMTEDEILYLIRTRAIPHRVEDDGRYTFTEREILARIIPKPTREAMGRPQFDISKMTKDDIMELFSEVLKAKALEEEKALKTVLPKRVELTEEELNSRPSKKDMEIPEEEKEKEDLPAEKTEGEIHDLPVTDEKTDPEVEEPKEEKTEPEVEEKKEDPKKGTKTKDVKAEKPKK